MSETFTHPGPTGTLRGPADATMPAIGPRKVFVKPFRLVFKKTETQEITWIEVASLDGLRTVADRIANGDLVPIDGFSTLDRQLWGHLAEHVGFLRVEDKSGEFSAGIQPMGPQGQLADDMSEIFGGVEPALQALSDIRDRTLKNLIKQAPVEPVEVGTFVKDDGVNLTEAGEEELAKLVHESPDIKTQMAAENAEVIAQRTEVDVQEEKIAEADASYKELQSFSGPEADEQGRKVEEAGNGELGDE